MLALLKVLSQRIKQSCGIHPGILQQLSRSILRIIGACAIIITWMTNCCTECKGHLYPLLILLLTCDFTNLATHSNVQHTQMCTVNGPFMERRRINSTGSNAPGLPEQPHHAFLAGAVGGYIVWGRYSGVNYQLILYLMSRIIVGGVKLARQKGLPPFSWKRLTFTKTYPWAAAGVWGAVMVMFEEYPEVLHPSLRRSMEEIYRYAGFGSENPSESSTR